MAAKRDGLFERAAGFSWRFLLIAAAGSVILWLLVRLRLVVLPVIAALFVTALLGPLAHRLRDKGLPNLLATWIVILGSLLLLVGIFAAIAPSVGDELDDVAESARQGFEDVLNFLASSPLELSRQDLERYLDEAVQQISQNREKITAGLLVGATKAVEFVTQLLLTLVLIFFFVKDGPEMFGWFESQFPTRNRTHVRSIGKRAANSITAYLRGTATIALVDAVLIGIVLLIVGVPLVLPLAVLTFFAAFFPLVGAIAAGVVAVLVALVTGGVIDALIVSGAILVIQQVEGDVLQPLVMGKAVSLHPVVILLVLTAGAILAGIVGAFLAVPIAAVAASVGGYVKSVNGGEGISPPAEASRPSP